MRRAELYSLDNTRQLDTSQITNIGVEHMQFNQDEPEGSHALTFHRENGNGNIDQMMVFNWASPTSVFLVA